MTDLIAQREARRLKLLKNAENRMNRLKFQDSETTEEDGKDILKEENKDVDVAELISTVQADQKVEEVSGDTAFRYNLRHRKTNPSSESPQQTLASENNGSSELSKEVTSGPKNSPTVPYEVVEDPEVPSLAEFLASQEATKATNDRKSQFMKKSSCQSTQNNFSEKRLEYIKVAGLFLTALLSRCFLSFKFGIGIFMLETILQSMFLPFLLFEALLTYVLQVIFKVSVSGPTQGSLLTTALMLCGVRAELIQVYIKVMTRVWSISNDLFLYIFAFLMWHLVLGS